MQTKRTHRRLIVVRVKRPIQPDEETWMVLDNTARGFVLRALGNEDDVIASSVGAKCLSDWAFRGGARSVKMDFDLKVIEDEL